MFGGASTGCGRSAALAATFVALLLVISGCGDARTPMPGVSSTPTMEASSFGPSAEPTGSSPSGLASSTDLPSADSPETEEPTDDPTPKPPVLTKDASGRDLTSTDFFSVPDGWQDGRFDAAGKQAVPGVSGEIEGCSDEVPSEPPTIELRLANNFSTISMVVAQGDDSEQSDAVMSVRAEGNGVYRDTASVPFNTTKKFSVSVAGVNAFKLKFWLNGKRCDDSKSVRVVISSLRVE